MALLQPSLGGKTSQAGAGAKRADGNAAPQNTRLSGSVQGHPRVPALLRAALLLRVSG